MVSPDIQVDAEGAAPAAAAGVREVKSAARTVEILEFLASCSNEPVRLSELSEALGVPRSSLHALLRTLTSRGWVRADPTGTLYGIGIRALLAGTSYLDTDPYLALVRPFLDELREQMDETFHVGRIDGDDIVYLATRESSQYLRPHSRIGRWLPAYSTALGKAILAQLTPADVAARLPPSLTAVTPRTLTDKDALFADLELTRQRGFAVDDEENTLGLRCFAVALHYGGTASDAISASVPIARLTDKRQSAITEALLTAGEQIGRSIGPIAGQAIWV